MPKQCKDFTVKTELLVANIQSTIDDIPVKCGLFSGLKQLKRDLNQALTNAKEYYRDTPQVNPLDFIKYQPVGKTSLLDLCCNKNSSGIRNCKSTAFTHLKNSLNVTQSGLGDELERQVKAANTRQESRIARYNAKLDVPLIPGLGMGLFSSYLLLKKHKAMTSTQSLSK